MKKTPLVHWIAALAVVLVSPQLARAQTTWTGGNTTNNWLTGANWAGGVAPSATNATVVFNAASSVSWTNATNTVGTLLVTGSTVIGNAGISTDVLELATSSGQPVISNTSTIFMYANVIGTQGFTKLGSGELSFRYNGDAQTYSGNINLLGGTFTVNQASSLGNVNNQLRVGSNATFQIFPGSGSGTVNFESTRTFVVSNGVTLDIRSGSNAITSVFSNALTGAGRIDFKGIWSGQTNDATAQKYVLAGANTWSGRTTIEMGAKVTLTNGSTLSTNELAFSGGNGSWAGLDLGGTTQNVQTFSPAGAAGTVRTIVISNGTLNVTAPSAQFLFNVGTNGTAVNMSGLTAFAFNGASNNRNFTFQPSLSTGGPLNTNYFYLAASGAGSNLISANTILFGNANGTSAGPGNESRLILGKTNVFNAQAFNIGQFNGSGVVEFGAGIVNGAVKLRGSNGTTAMTNLLVGDMNSGARRGTGILDLGIADALVTDTFLGQARASTVTGLHQTNSISMAGGNFVGTNLIIGMAASTITGATFSNVNTFTQTGGTSSITLVRMGDDRANINALNFISTYVLSGPNTLLRAQTIDAGTNAAYGANSVRTLQLSNGATLRNAAGANLSVNGFANTAAGRMNINLPGNGTVEADNGQSVTFGANTLVSGVGALTKTGAGTLVLQAANTHSGGTTLTTGAIEAAADGALGSGTIGLNGGTLLASGAARSYTNAVSVGGNVTLGGSGNALTFSGPVNLAGAARTLTISDNTTISGAITNGGLTKAGASTLTLSGANSYSGGTVVSAGTLVASGSGLQGAVTNDSAVILSGTGTYGGAMSGTGSLTKEGAGTYTLSGNSDFTGATTVSAGRLVVDGTSSASAVTVSSGASLGGIGEVAALTVGGTLAPGNSVGTLSAGNTTFLGGGAFELEMWDWNSSAGTGWDLLDITGDLTLSNTTGNKFTINLVSMSSATTTGLSTNFSSSSSFTNTFITYTGSLAGSEFSADLFNINTAAFQNLFAGTFSITNITQGLALVYTAPAAVSSYDWNTGSGDWATGGNWTNGTAPTNGAAISFSGAGGLSTNNEVSSISGMTFSGTSGSYTVSGDSLAIGAAGIVNESANSHTVQNDISFAGNSTFSALSNNLIISGNVTNSGGLLTVAGPNNVEISGVLSGAGSLSKTVGGTLTLSASNSYSGGTTLAAGTIAVGDDAALGSGTITLNGGTLAASGAARSLGNAVTIGADVTLGGLGYSLTLGGAVDLGGSMRIITTADNATLSGIVSNGGLTKSGSATLTLTGANTYSGGTLVSAGTLAGDTTGLQGAITNNAAVVFDQSANGTYSGAMSGSGLLEKTGAGTLTLTGANSYNGGTLVTLGALSGSTASLQGPITNNASVVFSQTTNGTYSGAMSGSGSLTKLGSGTITLSGANSYGGGTLVSAGALLGSTTSLQGPITNNAAIIFDQSADGTYTGALSGTGSLIKSGNGTLTFTGANSYTGTTTVNGGSITLGLGSALSTNAIIFSGSTSRTIDLGGNSQSFAVVTNSLGTAATTLKFTNGSLTISGAANQGFGATFNGSTTDLSGLSNFTFNGANRDFTASATGANVTNTVNFAAGANTITATNIRIGGGGSAVAGQMTLIKLGEDNNWNAGTDVFLGNFQGSANISFLSGLTSPTLTVRGITGGSSAVPIFRVANSGSGSIATTAILDLTGGNLDVVASEFDVGVSVITAGSIAGTGTLIMPSGNVSAGTLSIARRTTNANSGSPTVTGTMTQSGGTVVADNVVVGNNQGSGGTPTLIANYNLTGGKLQAATISTFGTSVNAASVRNLNLNGGTVQNKAGGDLSVNGAGSEAQNRLNIVLGASGGTFEADAGRNITVGANALISSTGRLNKIGDGTLTIASANTYSGGTLVGGGAVVADNNTAFGTGTVTLTNGAALAGAGQTIANNFVLGSPALTTNSFTSTNVAGWDFDGLTSGGADGLAPTTSANAGVSIVGLTRGFGMSANNATAGNAWGGTVFTNLTSAGAATDGQFAYFSITVSNGFALNLTNFDAYNVRRSGTGPTTGLWQYSLDGTNFADIGSAITWGSTTTSSGNAQAAVSLDGISGLQGIGGGTTVTLRVLNYGASASTGTWYLNNFQTGNDFSLNGAIATVTEGVASGSGTVGIQEAGTAIYSGNFTVNNAGTLTAAAGGQSSFTGVFTGGASTSLAKSGVGTVTLSGNNSYAGSLSVNEGILELATSGGAAAGSVASISVTNATLLISQNNQVNDGATISLSGGTISRASGVSETFGALNLTDASSLDFGSGTSGNLTFGIYEGDATPSALLTVNNFFGGNTLTFGSDLSGYIAASYNGTAFTSDYFNINSTSGGFTSSWNGSTFTITAIPEPSTYLAAAGLLGLMLWPSRRRILKDAKSILGFRAPMRDRLARR